ncbi:MAG: hypothetical protein SVZ03_10385 [Spirochaetota bacterium]|nr:hypothetical protein [Spirochaetota bacterium]
MADEISQYESLNEKSKLIDIALKHTNNDMGKAKLMASGAYFDVEIIKGKFAIERTSVFGVFLVFINIINEYIMNMKALLLNTNIAYSKVNIFDNWKTYNIDFENFVEKEGENAIQPYNFTNHIIEALEGYNIFSDVGEEDIEKLTAIIRDVIMKFYKSDRLNCQIAMEKSSSLALELEGIPVIAATQSEKHAETEDIEKGDENVSNIEKTADHVIDGRVIVSPIKGKYINDIKVGDKIKVLFTSADNKSQYIAKKLDAFSEDGEFLPVNARVKEKIQLDKSGFLIYGLIAKNILVKIIEEENVKIEVDSYQSNIQSEKKGYSKKERGKKESDRLVYYIILSIGLIVVLAFILLSML